MTDELDARLHRSDVYRVGHVRLSIQAIGATEPAVHVEGDVEALDVEEKRSVAVVMGYLAGLIEQD